MDDQELLLALRRARDVIARAMVPVEEATDEMPAGERKGELTQVVAGTDRALGGLHRVITAMQRGGVP